MIDADHEYGTVFGEYPALPGYLVQPLVRPTGELVPFYHDGQQAPIYALATALAVAKTQSMTGRLDFSVELELQSRNQAVAEVSSRSTIRRLLKPRYRISIDQGLQFLLLDFAAALVVQRPIKHAFGSAALGKEFDESEIQSMLRLLWKNTLTANGHGLPRKELSALYRIMSLKGTPNEQVIIFSN